MARWRQMVELAMADEERGRLAAIAAQQTGTGANAACYCNGAKTWCSSDSPTLHA
jgi:hypothetical protein